MEVELLVDEDLNKLVAEKVMLEKKPSLDLLKNKDVLKRQFAHSFNYERSIFSPQKNWYASTTGFENGDENIWLPVPFTQRWDEAIRALKACAASSFHGCLEAELDAVYDGNYSTFFLRLSPRRICEILVSVVMGK